MNHYKLITWTTVPGFEVLYAACYGLYCLRSDGVTRGPFFSWDLKWAAENWRELA